MAAINLPFAASATRRVPTSDELANGYGCGDADLELFDWLAWYFSGQINEVIEGAGLTTDDTDLQQLLKAIRKLVISDASIVGRTQIFTASGTFTVPAGVTSVEVEAWGGGGAGGASGDGSAGGVAGNAGGGGGGGGYGYKRIFGLVPAATVAVTVGAAGVASTSLASGSGGASSFGAHMTSGGGAGGPRGTLTTADGGAGGTVTGADLDVTGGEGGRCGANTASAPTQSQILNIYVRGGNAAGGLSTLALSSTGSIGGGRGTGGNGASGGSSLLGGNGAPGLVIVRY